jgi:hypothetical protein
MFLILILGRDRLDSLKRDRVKQEEKEERKRGEGVAVGVPSESNEREEKSCRHTRSAYTFTNKVDKVAPTASRRDIANQYKKERKILRVPNSLSLY